jgi:S1-C subfamily serine protease
MHYNGEGMPKNARAARKWYRKAADKRNVEAQHKLALLYLKGEGVRRDEVEACKWFLVAAQEGDSTAVEDYLILQDRLNSNQRANAARLSAEFRGRLRRDPDEIESIAVEAARAARNASTTGTGFFVTTDGHLVTSAHLVRDAEQATVHSAHWTSRSTVVYVDWGLDIAVLKLPAGYTPLPIDPGNTAKPGDAVRLLGFPNTSIGDTLPALTKTQVESVDAPAVGVGTFQVHDPLLHGNSGAAILDARGNVVGIAMGNRDLPASDANARSAHGVLSSSALMQFLRSIPAVANKLPEPHLTPRSQEEIVRNAYAATLLVVVER